ncbi:MAG: LacI family DNA-binding transcriptional regulator [Gemmatimonadota bacterium]
MVTIRDVARAAGVSVATVSRVYNGNLQVKEDTRKRVREIAAEMGYTPHGGARSLITRRTHAIGVLLPDLYGEFFSELIRGIDQAARARGYHVLVARAGHAGDDLLTAFRAMRGRVDGVIVMSPEFDQVSATRGLPEGFPVVLLNSPRTDVGSAHFGIANFEGAHAMVRHLIQIGHTRIAIIKGAERNHDAAERLRGYQAALVEAGIQLDGRLEIPGDFTEHGGYEAARAILALAPRPTAVFASNDGMALGALGGFRDAGLRVPGDIAIGGFDDIPMARYVDPPLTTVRVDISTLGARAAASLLEAANGNSSHAPHDETMPTTLVVRRSCGSSSS